MFSILTPWMHHTQGSVNSAGMQFSKNLFPFSHSAAYAPVISLKDKSDQQAAQGQAHKFVDWSCAGADSMCKWQREQRDRSGKVHICLLFLQGITFNTSACPPFAAFHRTFCFHAPPPHQLDLIYPPTLHLSPWIFPIHPFILKGDSLVPCLKQSGGVFINSYAKNYIIICLILFSQKVASQSNLNSKSSVTLL